MDEFVPISVAAEQSGMTYAAVYQMYRRKRVKTQQKYGRPYIRLNDVVAHKRLMDIIGTAKHAPNWRAQLAAQETADAQPA